MKKVLTGVLALSAVSLAALSLSEPQDQSVYFYGDQTGRIPINMTVRTEVSLIKYVVYSKVGDPLNNISEINSDNEVINLPPFTMTGKSLSWAVMGFGNGEKPTVYVQRVGDDGSLTKLADDGSENLYMRWIPSSDWTPNMITTSYRDWGKSVRFQISPLQFMTKSALEELIKPISATLGIANGSQDTPSAYIAILMNGREYISLPIVEIYNDVANGQINIDNNVVRSGPDEVTTDEMGMIERLFANGQVANSAVLAVRVGA